MRVRGELGQYITTAVCALGHDKAVVGKKTDGECKQCVRDRERPRAAAARLAKSPEELYAINRRSKLKRSYNITVDEYEAMLDKQDGGCAICGLACKTGWRLAVDHDHRSGKVRGLLCANCNQAIGKFQDNQALVDRASAYLERNA